MMTRLLPVFLLTACASKASRLQAGIEKGKHLTVERKAAKTLAKKGEKLPVERRDALRTVWGNAVVADLRSTASSTRALWFLETFPLHDQRAEVQEIAASLALDAILDPSSSRPPTLRSREASLVALANTYWPSPSAKEAGTLAARERLEETRANGGSPWDYDELLLRFPGFDLGPEQHNAPLVWAREQDTPTAWQQVLDAYPDHPDRELMLAEYRRVAWSRIKTGAESQSTIWTFARRFHGSKEADQAVALGLELAARVVVDPGSPLDSVTVAFDAPAPAGYGLDVDLLVDGSPWATVATARVKQLSPSSTLEVPEADLVQKGKEATWRSTLPLCRLSASDTFTAVVTLRDGDRELAQRELSVPVERNCLHARQMVFSSVENDIDGPLAVLTQDEKGAWSTAKPAWHLPEGADCTHATAITEWGVMVECGKMEVLAGWDARSLWIRETDGKQRRTERAQVATIGPKARPVSVSGRGSRKRLLDRRGRTLAKLGTRDAVAAEAPPTLTFAGDCVSCDADAAPALPATLDVPTGSGAPMPEGAVADDSCPSIQLLPGEPWGVGGDTSMVMPERPVLDPDQLPPALQGWVNVVTVPGRPVSWQCFSYEGHSYARTVAMQGTTPQVLTLRSGGDRWLVDVTSLR